MASHDHLVVCYSCGMIIDDIRDCPCMDRALDHRHLCRFCYEEKTYERQEAKRNADH